MKKAFENKLSMYLTVQKVCNENSNVWTGVAACSNAIELFDQKITEIANARQIQENSHSGVTQDKLVLRETMADRAMIVKGAVQAYATDTNNNDLYASVNYSNTAIKRQADTVARDRALLIYNKAMTVSTFLADYGVSSTMLTDFQTDINDYVDIMSKPRIAISTVKASTRLINQLFIDADLILKRKIDKLMIQFKPTNSNFYNIYTNARLIVDSGKGSQTLEVKLKSEEMITIQRVINGSTLTNTGPGILRYCGDHLPPCDAGDENATLLQPGQSIEVNIKESFVTVTNTDVIKKGSFKVKVTSTFAVAEPQL